EPLRAGISSFGIGGTNAHVVLEEGPLPERSLVGDSSVLLVFSAKTPTALNKMTENFINFLKENPCIDMNNAAFTLQVGRREFDHKRFLVCNSREDAIKALENINAIPKRVFDSGEAAIYHDKKFDDNNIKGYALEELGHFWLSGVKIDWNELSKGSRCKRIPLPHYPFEGQSYWAESKKTQDGPVVRDTNFKNSDISEWFYSPIWKQSAENITFDAEDPDVEGKSLLVLLSENEFENRFIALLRESLKESGVNVITAVRGEKYQKINDYTFFINHGNKDNYEILLKELDSMGKVPAIIINMFGITSNDDSLHESIDCGRKLFYSMIFLAQAIGKLGWKNLISIKVLTNNLQRVFGEEKLSPGKALVIGPHKVIPREYPNIKCSSIDFLIPESNSVSEEMLLYNLLSEVMLKNEDVDVAYRGSERWIQEFEKVRLNSGKKPVLALKKGGVYLITGGLGAIGLVFAQYLAKEVQARLILVSRVSFPDMNEWDQWVNNHDYDNNTSLKIKQLKRFQELGAEIIVCQADVKDAEQVKKVCTMAIDRFGEINGVIHAAGIPGGGMIQLKNREFCENVFSPKVEGTMALYYALKDYNIDFIILNSSLNAITGGFGQSDYSSANAFMDTFAKKYNSQGGTRIISINWDRWPGVGMAVNIEQSSDRSKEINPLLGRKILNTPEKIVYLSQLSPEKDWVLSEHKVMGIPTVAGTTYLEMARAAFLDISGENAIYISDVTFLTPMAVRENGKQDVITILTRNGTGFDFKVFSKPYSEDMQNISWQEHARGRVESAKDVTMKKLNLAELFKKCNENIINTTKGKGDISQEFISFGDRWNSLNGLSIGSNEGIVEVEIKEDFKMDLERFKLHPALLDVATGSIRLICGGNYLPLSYESIVVKGWLKKKIFGYIRFKDDFRTINEIITCDIDILSDKGEELVTIKNFSMKLINDTSAENIKSRNSNSHLIQVNEISKLYRESIGMKASILSEGITPDEGCAVLTSVLKGCYKPQVIVSTKDILSAIKQASYIDQLDISKDVEEDDPQAYHPRPELSCEYVGPRNETEQKLVGIWQRLLGIDKVGILDDFFELGGDSLLLVQLHSKIKDIFKTDISTVDLYKYNTVSLLRKFFDEENSVVEKSSFESVNQRANKKLEMIKQRRKQMIMKGMN
ncbi:MAG: SDR family NAD(P)-dependent oxidoreductase, partial [Bacillota bacterium]|nr:SDR family NAD(P)-dependent oxidoreductase [Bacillota bacterium]